MNVTEYYLTALATCPTEIKSIETRLKVSSTELVRWVAERFDNEPSASAENVTELVAFQPQENLFHMDESVNKARRFHNSFKWFAGIVDSHILEVSAEYPNVPFLLYYCDCQSSYSGKTVIHGGVEVQNTRDSRHHAQGLDWALIDIFAPYKAEYEMNLPFGSLWDEWLRDVGEAVEKLKMEDVER